jgi:hypothetical protein
MLAGCASRYHEPSRTEDVAYLTATAPVWISTIDGKSVSRAGILGEKQFALAPGDHVVQLQFSGSERRKLRDQHGRLFDARIGYYSRSNYSVTFTAHQSRHYYVHDGRMDNQWRPFVSEDRDPVFLDLPIR